MKEKIKRTNFITILCDGLTDSAVVEKESIYVLFVDPDTFYPTLSFFSLKSVPSQDAKGVYSAIKDAFKEEGLEEVLKNWCSLLRMERLLTVASKQA